MTTDRAALYRAVCAHPDDDTPRLVFADLLEEEGDADTAAFIRTQVELARVPDHDPFALASRWDAPDALLGWTMAHTLPAVPVGFEWRKFAFRRGFPWLVGVSDPDAAPDRLADLFAAAPVQALSFYRGRPYTPGLADSPHLARVCRLEFEGEPQDAHDLARLGHSPHAAGLRELAFGHDGIDADGLRALARSPLFARLTALELPDNRVPSDLVVETLSEAREPVHLRHLSLAGAGLFGEDVADLFALPVVQGLVHLDLSNNRWLGPVGAAALAASGALHGMRRLDLCRTRPGVEGIKALAAAGGLAGVRWLDLSENRLGPKAVRPLVESAGVRGLRVLHLRHNPLGDAGAAAVAGSRHLAGLLDLGLADAGIGDAGAEALADSAHLDSLIALDLRMNRISPVAAARLVERFGDRVRL